MTITSEGLRVWSHFQYFYQTCIRKQNLAKEPTNIPISLSASLATKNILPIYNEVSGDILPLLPVLNFLQLIFQFPDFAGMRVLLA